MDAPKETGEVYVVPEPLALREALLKVAIHEAGHLLFANALGWKTKQAPIITLRVGPSNTESKKVKGDIYMEVVASDKTKPNLAYYAAGYAAERMHNCFTDYYSREDNEQIPNYALDKATDLAKQVLEPYTSEINRIAEHIVSSIGDNTEGVYSYKSSDFGLDDFVDS